ncbi:MAG: ATP-binding protein [Deltaproteobacteria bacterium]|nr:ATP-binding protein [Deltaproteobacteria bacterium]
MILLGGPRQVGKTTLATSFLTPPGIDHPAYFNWDFVKDRPLISSGELPWQEPVIVLDEIHKFARWRGLLKGFFDKFHRKTSLLVTGSAKLDHYRKGGDSMLGRYRYFRLHPFSLMEMSSNPKATDLDHLMKFGGFPEPLSGSTERELRLWQLERTSKVVREDLRDLESVKEISLVELLVEALPTRVGAPLSIKSLREDLEVAHETVDRWVGILENLYYCYRIAPFGSPRIKAVKKEQKLYLWDHAQVPNDGGFRFENLVANQLLKFCHFRQDTQGHRMELRFIRDVDRHEIDFIVLEERRPIFAVECKTGEKMVSPSITYFKPRIACPRYFQVHRGTKDYVHTGTGCRVLPFTTFCHEMKMP